MNNTLFIGVDPGKSGAIAFIDTVSGDCWTVSNDSTLHDLYQALIDAQVSIGGNESHAIIEKVHSSPQMGVKSAFTFGQSFGQLEALLVGAGISYEYVSPAKWQGDMKCRTKGNKNVTKAAAQRLFPKMKITHANADAILIAEYSRRNAKAKAKPTKRDHE